MNKYEVNGEVSTLFIQRKNGEVFEVLIDTDDLPKLIEFDRSWCLSPWRKDIQGYYVMCSKNLGNRKYTTIYLHRFLKDCEDGFQVDHRNNNQLDNRKENLRVVTPSGNMHNRRTSGKKTKSGVQNVYLKRGYWVVKFMIKGESKNFGKFLDLEKAREVSNYIREKLRRGEEVSEFLL